MKLVVVSPFFPEISGVGQYGVRVVEGLARTRRFTSVHVLANAQPGAAAREQRDGLIIERVWGRDRYDSAQIISDAIRRLRPDVVWFNLGLSIYGRSRVANFLGHTAPMQTRLMGVATVVTLHELFEMANLNAIGAANGRLTLWGGAIATRMILRADAVCLTCTFRTAHLIRPASHRCPPTNASCILDHTRPTKACPRSSRCTANSKPPTPRSDLRLPGAIIRASPAILIRCAPPTLACRGSSGGPATPKINCQRCSSRRELWFCHTWRPRAHRRCRTGPLRMAARSSPIVCPICEWSPPKRICGSSLCRRAIGPLSRLASNHY